MRWLCLTLCAVCLVSRAPAVSTITATNKFAWGANLGWLDWRGDTNNGAVIGEYVCSGSIYAANAGWINLGNGSPTNGIRYQNLGLGDFGVNHDGQGNLRGYAYGANIGWINFESNGAPHINLSNGRFTGFVYSANCGWIALSNAWALVQTTTITPGADTDGDGMADAWERDYFGGLAAGAGADPDNDGFSNLQEYLAGTNPNDTDDKLLITSESFSSGGTAATLAWRSSLTRNYTIEKTLDLSASGWFDSGLGLIVPDGASTTRNFGDTNAAARFYRVRAFRPLLP
jgi:hypothetical protein